MTWVEFNFAVSCAIFRNVTLGNAVNGKVVIFLCDTVHYRSSLQDAQQEDNRPFKDWVLQKETELRLEVGNEDIVDIRVY